MVKWKDDLFNHFPLYPLYLAYQGEQVISIPQDPHADSHAKRHLEIFSLFREPPDPNPFIHSFPSPTIPD
jgi:hypothetical protein